MSKKLPWFYWEGKTVVIILTHTLNGNLDKYHGNQITLACWKHGWWYPRPWTMSSMTAKWWGNMLYHVLGLYDKAYQLLINCDAPPTRCRFITKPRHRPATVQGRKLVEQKLAFELSLRFNSRHLYLYKIETKKSPSLAISCQSFCPRRLKFWLRPHAI